MSIEGLASLVALQKALIEAKFHPNPENLEVIGSPLVASIADRVFDAIVDAEEAAGRSARAADWREWRRAPKWILERVRQAGSAYPHWSMMDETARRDWIRSAVSPFQLEETAITRVVQEIAADR